VTLILRFHELGLYCSMPSAGSKTVADYGERIRRYSLHSVSEGGRTAVRITPITQGIVPICFEFSIGLGSADHHPGPGSVSLQLNYS
jgi:hypothetical protein